MVGADRMTGADRTITKIPLALLPTARVHIRHPRAERNVFISMRALCDPGSQVNLIREKFVKLLSLQKMRTNIRIRGVSMDSGAECRSYVQVIVSSHFGNEPELSDKFLVVKEISNYSPSSEWPASLLAQANSLQLADPFFDKPGEMDILIGAGFWAKVVQSGVRSLGANVTAQSSKLGWTLFGEIGGAYEQYPLVAMTTTDEREHCSNEKLSFPLRKLFDMDWGQLF